MHGAWRAAKYVMGQKMKSDISDFRSLSSRGPRASGADMIDSLTDRETSRLATAPININFN